MANKILTYEEFTGSSDKTKDKILAYANYLKNNPTAKSEFYKIKNNG